MGADDQGRIPVPAQRRFVCAWLRLDRYLLLSPPVVPDQPTILILGVDGVRVFWIDAALETVPAKKNVPVAIGGAVGTHRACRPAQGAVVLRAAVYPVERGVSLFTCDIVKLGDRQIGGVLPIGGPVEALVNAAVTAYQVVVRIARVDPDFVVVNMGPPAAQRA